MAEVIGTITGTDGTKDILLNNAATETTLRALLQATLNASKQTRESVASIAEKAGLDPAAVEAANNANLRQVGILEKVGAAYGGASVAVDNVAKRFATLENTVKQITVGTGDASGALTSLGNMIPGVLGSVVRGFSNLINYQETLLKSYQDLSKVGATFGGSLTDMRLAASNTYMTLDQFSKVVRDNGEVLSKLGGSVETGVKAFVKASNTLLSSDAGDKLRALGYTTEEVNNGMLTYIAMTGGRNKKELENTEALKKSTEEYLLELDELARLTGKSKEEAQAKAKQAMMDANFQLFLSTKSKAEREVIEANVKRAAVLYGKGGEDIAKANAMGVAVQGEAGRRLTALSVGTADSIKKDLDLRRQYGNRSKEVQDNEIKGRQANAESLGRFAGPVGSFTDALKGNEDAVRQAATDRIQGEEGIKQQYKDVADERTKTEQSQARQAVETQAAMQKLAQQILENVVPVISALWKVINPLVQSFANVVTALLKVPGLFETLGVVVGAVTALYIAQKAAMAVRAVSGVAGAARTAVASRGVGGAIADYVTGRGRPGGPTPPAGGGTPLAGLPGGGGVMSTAATGVQTLGGAIKGVGVGLGGAIKGILTGLAKGLQALANPKVLMGVGVLAALGGSLFIAGKAFQAFSNIDWANVTIGTVAIAALAAGAAALSLIAPMVLIGSAAIAALGASIWLVGKGLSAFPTGAIDGMLKPFNALGEITGNVFGAIGDLISGLLGTIKSVFGVIWDVISWPFKQIGKLVSSTFDVISDLTSGLMTGIKNVFGVIWDVISWPFKQLGSLVSATFGLISDVVSGVLSGIKTVFGFIWDVISWPFKQIGSLVSSAFNTIKETLSSWFENIKNVFSGVFNVLALPFKLIKAVVTGSFEDIGKIIGSTVDSVKGIFGGLWNIIKMPFELIGGVVTSAFNFVKNIFSNTLDFAKSIFSSVWDTVSAPFTKIGSLVSGAFDSVKNTFSGLYESAKSIFSSVWDTVSAPFTKIGSLVSGAFDSVKNTFFGISNAASGAFNGLLDIMKKPFTAISNFVSAPFETISSVFNNFKNTIGNVFNWIWEKVTSVTNLIKSAGQVVGKIFGIGSNEDKSKTAKEKEGKENSQFVTASNTLLTAANTLKGVADTLNAIFPPELAAEVFGKDKGKTGPITVKLPETLQKLIAARPAYTTQQAAGSTTLPARSNEPTAQQAAATAPGSPGILSSIFAKRAEVVKANEKEMTRRAESAAQKSDFLSTSDRNDLSRSVVERTGIQRQQPVTEENKPRTTPVTASPVDRTRTGLQIEKKDTISKNADLESLLNGITMLNNTMGQVLFYMKETADYTRRGVDATKSLSGDMFRL